MSSFSVGKADLNGRHWGALLTGGIGAGSGTAAFGIKLVKAAYLPTTSVGSVHSLISNDGSRRSGKISFISAYAQLRWDQRL